MFVRSVTTRELVAGASTKSKGRREWLGEVQLQKLFLARERRQADVSLGDSTG
jgi:hypothetical protein